MNSFVTGDAFPAFRELQTPHGQQGKRPCTRREAMLRHNCGRGGCSCKQKFLLHERDSEFLIAGWHFEHSGCRFFKNEVYENGD